jgi:outer membrane protein insertion porin family
MTKAMQARLHLCICDDSSISQRSFSAARFTFPARWLVRLCFSTVLLSLCTLKVNCLHAQSPDDLPPAPKFESVNLEAGPSPNPSSDIVADVIIKGNQQVPTHRLTCNIRTRPGRYFDPDLLQQDVNQLWKMKEIRRINGPFIEHTPQGVVVTIEVVERNLLNTVKFIGNRGISDRTLKRETQLEDGKPLDLHEVRMAKTRIEEYYREKGYPRTQVEILEGDQSEDPNVVFLIHEDQQQKIWNVQFEGNSIASDARLRHFIKSKPAILKVFGGLVNREEVDQDILRITAYYRSLGFFNARIGREISESNDGRWLTIHFIIDEGPRYRVRNVAFIGNQTFASDQLMSLVELKPQTGAMPEFNVAKMNKDVVALRDLYGSQGYVFAEVQAEPRFLEEPGLLDLVYKVEEGQQYRVGKINVHIEGDLGITKREVVMNPISLRPGDLIDSREIRNSERRLGAAQIFAGGDPTSAGQAPKIVVRPPELQAIERMAQNTDGTTRY